MGVLSARKTFRQMPSAYSKKLNFKPAAFLLRGAAALAMLFASVSASAQNFQKAEDNVVSVKIIGEEQTFSVLNLDTGFDTFYTSGIFGQNVQLANIEAGHFWTGHEAFTNSTLGEFYTGQGALGTVTEHATMVAGVIGSLGPDLGDGSYSYLSFGMAPLVTLNSGAIATQTGENGSFDISLESFFTTYRHFFSDETFGTETCKRMDVVNSSWGASGLAEADNDIGRVLDALCAYSPKTTFVVSSGNSGDEEGSIGGTGTAYNGITVGAMGNPLSYDTIADFSSRGAADFYNPITGQTVQNAVAAVDICAPGENIGVAYYDSENTTDTSSYVISSGTSFSAPIVAAGAALLISASYALEEAYPATWSSDARDSRVIKAVLLNSASKPSGWSNNQYLSDNVEFKVQLSEGIWASYYFDNVTVTTQGLDYNYGAGVLDMDAAFDQYLTGSQRNGWVLDTVLLGADAMYSLGTLTAQELLTVTLVWQVYASTDLSADLSAEDAEIVLSDYAFSDLNLEIWLQTEDGFEAVALSSCDYNNVEHLYLELAESGEYYLRVVFESMLYGTLSNDLETFALAWSVVPEAANFAACLGLAAIAFAIYKRRHT